MSSRGRGHVVAIYVSPQAGVQLHSVAEAALEAHRGIVGDRYHLQVGTFSEKLKDKGDWQATLIELEEVERFNAEFGASLGPGSFRRNIVTAGVRLNDLVGEQFSVGSAVLEGVRLCEPCAYLGQHLGPEVVRGMAHKAGLRVRILTSATIRPGDLVTDQGSVDT
jgi:MOSC domain-containing protein YiiM